MQQELPTGIAPPSGCIDWISPAPLLKTLPKRKSHRNDETGRAQEPTVHGKEPTAHLKCSLSTKCILKELTAHLKCSLSTNTEATTAGKEITFADGYHSLSWVTARLTDSSWQSISLPILQAAFFGWVLMLFGPILPLVRFQMPTITAHCGEKLG